MPLRFRRVVISIHRDFRRGLRLHVADEAFDRELQRVRKIRLPWNKRVVARFNRVGRVVGGDRYAHVGVEGNRPHQGREVVDDVFPRVRLLKLHAREGDRRSPTRQGYAR